MEDLRPNDLRASRAITWLWISIVVHGFSIIADLFYYANLKAIKEYGNIHSSSLESVGVLLFVVGIAIFIVGIISAITFIEWFRRAYFNLHVLVHNLSHTEGWAAGSWFVPLINLYRPYQIMEELYVETENFLKNNDEQYTPQTSTRFLGWWWMTFLLSNILSYISLRVVSNAHSIGALVASNVLSLMSAFIGIPSLLLGIRIIKDYRNLEDYLMTVEFEPAGIPPIPGTEDKPQINPLDI